MRAKILVIEDERATRDSISFFLAAQGYNVVTATNGKEALELLAKQVFEMVLLDIEMPVMNAGANAGHKPAQDG